MGLIEQLFRPAEPLWFETTSGRNGTFDAVAVNNGKRITVLGTRLAREGIAFVSAVQVRGSELPVTFTIRRRTIPSRVRILRGEMLRDASRVVHRYFCAFTAIADEDRAAVVRYVENAPDPVVAQDTVIDEPGVLSLRVRAEIADRLVRLKRLAAPAPGMAPLIRLEPEPMRELDDGRNARDVLVHSRVRGGSTIRSFMTRFRVYDDDHVDVLS